MVQDVPKSGTRCPEQDMGQVVPVSNGFGTRTETFNNTISMPLEIASSLVPVVYPASLTIVTRVGYQTSPRADWLPSLSKSYRNRPFLPVASWNPGKKITVIWSSCGMTNDQTYKARHQGHMEVTVSLLTQTVPKSV